MQLYENHNGIQYVIDLNIDIRPFNPIGQCNDGELYFTELDKLPIWLTYADGMICIRKTKIINDTNIYIEDNKFITDKFILSEKILIQNLEHQNDLEFCKIAIQQNAYALKFANENILINEIYMTIIQKKQL